MIDIDPYWSALILLIGHLICIDQLIHIIGPIGVIDPIDPIDLPSPVYMRYTDNIIVVTDRLTALVLINILVMDNTNKLCTTQRYNLFLHVITKEIK